MKYNIVGISEGRRDKTHQEGGTWPGVAGQGELVQRHMGLRLEHTLDLAAAQWDRGYEGLGPRSPAGTGHPWSGTLRREELILPELGGPCQQRVGGEPWPSGHRQRPLVFSSPARPASASSRQGPGKALDCMRPVLVHNPSRPRGNHCGGFWRETGSGSHVSTAGGEGLALLD